MVYATYEYYKNKYYGETIPLKAFSKMIAKASQYIDNFTFGRITEGNKDEFPSLSACACDMAETIYRMQGTDGMVKEKKSENTDGYSVSYVTECVDGKTAEDTLKKKLYAIAETYLLTTGLLYLGC